MNLEKYSIGVGDRFARQGEAQLRALDRARKEGVSVVPVWNKSHREHSIVGSVPAGVRREADNAVQALQWQQSYYVDADHIGMSNVDLFIEASDFFTLDVADYIGQKATDSDINAFVARHGNLVGAVEIPGMDAPLPVTEEQMRAIAAKFLLGVQEAGRIFRHIASRKAPADFVTEVSMDETDEPQSPVEMLFILAALADEGVPAQTIAPKFTGRFNKGIDYVGDVDRFTREFREDLAVIAWSVKEFGLPANLKLSVHSGSDKFSIYGPMRQALEEFGAGIHLKTAGTTWLEELIGLALAGEDGLAISRDVYAQALLRYDELAGPYATVIDIDRNRLPSADEVSGWTGEEFADALRHDQTCERYNRHFRQLLHIAYKIAAEMGDRYLDALDAHREVIGRNVDTNIYERHLKALLPGL